MTDVLRSAHWLMLAVVLSVEACDASGAGRAPVDASAAADTEPDATADATIDARADATIDRDAGVDPITSLPDAEEAGGDSGVTVLQVSPLAPITTVSAGQNRSVTLAPPQAIGNPCGWLGVESAGTAAFTPDGALLVTGAADGLHVYDARSGAHVRAISAGLGTRQPISMSSDGALVAARTGVPTVYRVADGSALFVAPSDAYQHGPVALSPDGTRITSESFTLGNVDTWDIASGQRTSTLVVSAEQVVIGGLAYSPRGDWLAVSLPRGHLQLWSIATGQKMADIVVQLAGSMANDVVGLSFSPDGAFVGVSTDVGAMVYRVPGLTALNESVFQGVPVFSADSTQYAVSARDGIYINSLTDAPRAVVVEHIAPSRATSLLAFSRADDHVALAGPHALAVQALGTSEIIWSADGDPGVPAIAPDARGFYGINVAGELRSWSARGQIQSVVQTPLSMQSPVLIHYVTSFDISPDGHRLAALMPYNVETLSLDQVSASSPLVRDSQSSVVGPIRFAPDGASVMTVEEIGPTERGALDARPHRVFQKDPQTPPFIQLQRARYSPDGALLVVGGPVMDVWRRSDGTLLRRLQSTPLASLDALAFSPSGATLATCDSGGTLSLWDTSSWTIPLATRPYDEPCTVAFTADGKGVLTWSETDSAIRLWSAADLSPVAAMPATRFSNILGVATTPAGQQIAGVDMNGFSRDDDHKTFLYCLPAIP